MLQGEAATPEGENILDVTIEDGKYRIILPPGGGMKCLRYGEEWRDLTGDKLVLLLAMEVRALRSVLGTVMSKVDW